MRKLLILISLSLGLGLSAQKAPAKENSTEAILRSGNYSLTFDYMFSSQVNRNITDVRTFTVRNDSVMTSLPYVGRAYNARIGSEGGIVFSNAYENYEITTKKNSFLVRFNVRHNGELYDILLDIDQDGSASMSVSSSYRSSIRYFGELNKGK